MNEVPDTKKLGKLVYIAVKNYIRNTLGIDIRTMIEDEVRKQVQSLLSDSSYVESLLRYETRESISWRVQESVADRISERLIVTVKDSKNE